MCYPAEQLAGPLPRFEPLPANATGTKPTRNARSSGGNRAAAAPAAAGRWWQQACTQHAANRGGGAGPLGSHGRA